MGTKDIMTGPLILVITLGIVFLFTEIGLRIYTHYRIYYDIEMSRYAMSLKIQSENPDIGHEHRPGGKAKLMGVLVSINNDGFRDRDYAVKKKSGVRRIAILGDSLTFGWGVKAEESFAQLLEEYLDKQRPTEAINFGTGNYNTAQEVSLFKEKGLKYGFDDVVVFYFINDAEPTPRKSSLELLGHVRTITFFWSRITAVQRRFTAAKPFFEYYSALYQDGEPGFEGMKRSFADLKKITADNKMNLKVIFLPELHNLVDYPFKAEHARVSAYLDSLDIENLDLTPAFAGRQNAHELWVALDDAHPNALAHKIIAEHAFRFLTEQPAPIPTEAVPTLAQPTMGAPE